MNISMVYVKKNNQIIYSQRGIDDKLKLSYVLCMNSFSYDALKEFIEKHRAKQLARSSFGIISEEGMRLQLAQKEFVYEIDLNKLEIRAYASNEKSYEMTQYRPLSEAA